MLRAEMLGGFRVWWQDQPLQFPSRQARSLLAYLLVHPRFHLRDHLAGLFWPDLPDDQARKRLSQTLWQIRQVLGVASGFIGAQGDRVGWIGEAVVESDHGQLNAALKGSDHNQWRKALELYRGEFLPGHYDDWVLQERDGLLQLLLSKLEQLIRHYRAQGQPKEALEMARTLAALEPLHDQAHQEAMRLCLLLGKPREALEHFRKARAALEELGETPGPELEALKQQAELLRETPQQTSSPLEGSGGLMLVGRGAEYGRLLEVLAQVQMGQGRLVLLEGEAGMGKSRLLQELAREAGWRGFGLLSSKANERSGHKPFGLLQEAFGANLSGLWLEQLRTQLEAPWLQAVAQVVPALGKGGSAVALRPEDEPTRMREGLARLLQSLSRWAPQVLLLDDLHWADEATLEALPYLVRAMAGCPVLLILGYRSSEARERAVVFEALQKLSPQATARLELMRLSESETAELVRRSLGLAWSVPRFEARIYHETQGNPLFVLETLRSLYEEGLLHRDPEGVWSTPVDELTEGYQELPLAPTVRQVIVERLGRLPQAIRQVVDALAVLGAAELDLLTEVVAQPKAEVLGMAASLIRQGLLLEREGKLAFAHDKIAQAAYEEMANEVRKEWHGRVGEVLEGKQAGPELLAPHFELAARPAKALEHYQLAAEQATRLHAYANALQHYNHALNINDLLELGSSRGFDLYKGKEQALNVLGRRLEQLETLSKMQELIESDPVREIEILIRYTDIYQDLSDNAQAEAYARKALDLAQPLNGQGIHAAALLNIGQVLLWRGLLDEAELYLRQAIEQYRALSDLHGESRARHSLGTLLVHQDLPQAKAEFERALDLHQQNQNLQGQVSTLILLAHYHRKHEEFVLAESLLERALSIAYGIGFRRGEAMISLNLGNLLCLSSQIGRGLGFYERSIGAFHAIGDRLLEAHVSTNWAYIQTTVVGDLERARERLEPALKISLELGDVEREMNVFLVLAQVEALGQNFPQAIEQMKQAIKKLEHTHNTYYQQMAHQTMGEILTKADHNSEALIHLQKVEEIASKLGQLGYVVPVNLLRARNLIKLGQMEAAASALDAAQAGDWDKAQPSAHTYCWLYSAATDLGRNDEAQSALQKAHKILQDSLQGLSSEQVQMSLTRIPEHRAIVAAWEAQNIQRQTFRIPSANAPTGRPLRDDEYIEVAWTTHTPEDEGVEDKTQRRQLQLERLIGEAQQQGAAPTLDDLAAALKSSKATIKRDLAMLRAKGVELKTRGSRG
jgi:predicted ATPase